MEGDCNVYAHSTLWMRPTRPDRYNMRMVYGLSSKGQRSQLYKVTVLCKYLLLVNLLWYVNQTHVLCDLWAGLCWTVTNILSVLAVLIQSRVRKLWYFIWILIPLQAASLESDVRKQKKEIREKDNLCKQQKAELDKTAQLTQMIHSLTGGGAK